MFLKCARFSECLFQTQRAIELLQKYSQDNNPFFLTLQFWGPHEVSMPTKEFADMYPPDKINRKK